MSAHVVIQVDYISTIIFVEHMMVVLGEIYIIVFHILYSSLIFIYMNQVLKCTKLHRLASKDSSCLLTFLDIGIQNIFIKFMMQFMRMTTHLLTLQEAKMRQKLRMHYHSLFPVLKSMSFLGA